MITACIFDFDGTIIDTEWSQYSTVRDEFALHGVEYDLELFQRGVGGGDHRHWSDVLQDLIGPREDIDEIRDRRGAAHKALIAESALRPGVVETMDLCEAADVTLAVASSSPIDWVGGHLTDRGLIGRFATIATCDRVERTKPSPEVFLLAAADLGIDPSACVAIEDSANGVRAAKDAGMVCVAVPNSITAPSDFSAADYLLESLTDFPAAELGITLNQP